MYNAAVIGGGPGGYTAAVRLQQYGLSVVIFEPKRLGGVCLNTGCIPTKALVKSAEVFTEARHSADYGVDITGLAPNWSRMQARKGEVVEKLVGGLEVLFTKRSIPIIKEEVTTIEKTADGFLLHHAGGSTAAQKVIIGTGSTPKSLPGLDFDHQLILNSDDLLAIDHIPESLAVIGGGVIGCEFASIFAALGARVEIIEFLPDLVALEDTDISKRLAVALKKRGLKLNLKSKVIGSQPYEDGVKIMLEGGKEILAEKALLSVGRSPIFTIKTAGFELNTERGALLVDDDMQTNQPGIYAIGDVTGKMPLAHTAARMGLDAAAHIAGRHHPTLVYANIPRCTFTDPEVASVGLTEAQAAIQGPVKTGRFAFVANGKALAMGAEYGMVKAVAFEDGRLCGLHIIGPQAAELVAQGAAMLGLKATLSDIENIVWAHPTLSECVMESLEDISKISIHSL